MNASSLEHACENPWATVRMAQLCSVIRQLPSDCGHASKVACSARPPTVNEIVWS